MYSGRTILNDVFKVKKRLGDELCDAAEPGPNVDHFAPVWWLFPRVA